MTIAKYINRELSWLEFNQRVLDQAEDTNTPLLERVKFLAITGSNLDEFFMVRVGGLLIQQEKSPEKIDIAGMSPSEQLAAIRQRLLTMVDDQYSCFEKVFAGLAEHGIRLLSQNDLSTQQRSHLQRIFEDEIEPVISPIAVADEHNFPAMIGTTLGLCVRMKGPMLGADDDKPVTRHAVLPVRRGLKRVWTVPSESGVHFVLLEDILSIFAERFFPQQEILERVPFRTIRNADVSVDEEAADLLVGMEAMLLQRKTSDCAKLELSATASPQMIAFLKKCLELNVHLIYLIPGPLDLAALMSLGSVHGYRELKFESWPTQGSPDFHPDENIFSMIAARDRVLVHPYQSYQPVVDFIMAAASDPSVIAIKQTLYRTSRESEVVEALRSAAESGKHVTVIVELKARFDEQRNITWARKLEQSGVDVIYGVRGLKTHAKICLVVRRETDGVRRYIHFGTGNYNESTAKIYSDISYFTCDSELGLDSVNLFNSITGQSIPRPMSKLVAAPLELRSKTMDLIDVEIASAQAGRPAMIRAKFNSLFDRKIINKLYEASQAGVRIELNVRGICSLIPGVPGLSENIRVVSIIDRFLEHARIFYFLHGGDHRVFIASADWMGRNLDRRIELMVPITDQHCAKRVNQTLKSYFDDNMNSYALQANGEYERRQPTGTETPHRSQQHLFTLARELKEEAAAGPQTFQPHRANTESA